MRRRIHVCQLLFTHTFLAMVYEEEEDTDSVDSVRLSGEEAS